MMMSDDKVGGWVKKGQNHDDVILEWSLSQASERFYSLIIEISCALVLSLILIDIKCININHLHHKTIRR